MSSRRIFIEGMGLVEDHFSGVGQYILGILRGLDELADRAARAGDAFPDIRVIVPRDRVARFQAFGFRHLRHSTLPVGARRAARWWRKGWMFPIDLWCGRGTYIFTRFVDMRLASSPSAVVVYDVSYARFPEFCDDKTARFLARGVARSVARADAIITISQNARREIAELYRLDPERIHVATPGVDPALLHRRAADEVEAAKRRYGISGEYILSLSNLEPRKNLDGLIEAYCGLPRSLTDRVALLLVGASGWKNGALLAKIEQRVAEGFRIVRPSSYVADADKAAIFSGASLLVYPSHYEGFGMPPVEALACGVPVITAGNSSLPEAVGNLGILVDSADTAALGQAIVRVFDDLDELSARIRIDGPAHAARFSWVTSAERFLDVAASLGGERGRAGVGRADVRAM